MNSILGLLSEEKVEKLGTPLDTISNHLANVLSYEPDERDMILMRHEVRLSQLSVESWEDFEFSNFKFVFGTFLNILCVYVLCFMCNTWWETPKFL